MITEVTMPSMGADMTEGTIVKWLKAEGDAVARGDKLAEIETDKTVVEMEAYANGLLRRIVVAEGGKVPVGDLIAYIGDADDEVPEIAEQAAAAAAAPVPAPPSPVAVPVAAAPPPPLAPAAAGGRVKASPMARRIARERNIDIAQVVGTGPGGRITRDDVMSYQPPAAAPAMAAAPAPEIDSSDVPLTSMRQAIARVTVRSKTEKPHFYVTVAVDMTDLMRLRTGINEALAESGVRVSVNDMIIKASANALIAQPKFNKFYEDDRLVGQANINIGIAIALEEGLIVPALLRCQGKSLAELSTAAKDLGRRARGDGGTLTQEELTGGTFAISNMGMLGVESFAAIIVPPQSAVLATGSVTKTPVVRDNQIVVADIMKATISVDHRVADGAEGAVFLNEIRKNLENPARLLL